MTVPEGTVKHFAIPFRSISLDAYIIDADSGYRCDVFYPDGITRSGGAEMCVRNGPDPRIVEDSLRDWVRSLGLEIYEMPSDKVH
ncbi:MAG TPA: hypothetical protein VJI12_03245 [archaeon]|nr:hypothetical protein [archaeon]